MVAWFYVYVGSCFGYQLPSCPLFWSAPTVCTPQWPLIFLTCPMSTAETHKQVTHELICAWKSAMPSVEMTMYASFPEKQTTNETDMIWLWYDMIFGRKSGQMNQWINEWINEWLTIIYSTQKTHLPCSCFFSKKKTRCHVFHDEISLLPVNSRDPQLVGRLPQVLRGQWHSNHGLWLHLWRTPDDVVLPVESRGFVEGEKCGATNANKILHPKKVRI